MAGSLYTYIPLLAGAHSGRSSAFPLSAVVRIRADAVGDTPPGERFTWPIVVLAAGMTQVWVDKHSLWAYVPPEVAQRDGPAVFSSVQSMIDHPTEEEDRTKPEGASDKIAGVIGDVTWDPTVGELGALVSDWTGTDPHMLAQARNAHAAGVLERGFEFSVNAGMDGEPGEVDGKQVFIVSRIVPGQVRTSVDTVTKGAAGGRFHTEILERLAASLSRAGGLSMDWATFAEQKPALAAAILAASDEETAKKILASLELEGLADDFETAMLIARTEHTTETAGAETEPVVVETPPVETPPVVVETPPVEAPVVVADAEVVAEAVAAAVKQALPTALENELAPFRAAQAKTIATAQLEAAGFDALTTAHMKPQVEADPAGAEALIASQRTYLAARDEANGFPATQMRGGADIQVGAGELEKFHAGIDGFFEREDIKLDDIVIPRFHSVREMIMAMPGETRRTLMPMDVRAAFVGWFAGNEHGSRVIRGGQIVPMQAAVTRANFAETYADRAKKKMSKDWHSSNMVDEVIAWASSREQYTSFNAHRIIKLGEYENPGSVAAGATYQPAATPGDTEETNSLTKWGFIEEVHMEALMDEDGQKLARLPGRMMAAMLRLVRQTLLNTITTTNANMSDGNPLYDAGNHSNLLTTALSITGLEVAAVAMMLQTSADAGEQIGSLLRPWGVMVPPSLKALAERINAGGPLGSAVTGVGVSVEIADDAFKGIKTLVLDHATNVKDHFIQADPAKVDTWEYATLRGINEPEFFTQDGEDSTSVFDADTIKWKVRFFFASVPIEWRAFFMQDVA